MTNLSVLKKTFSLTAFSITVLSFNISCTDGYSRIPEKFYTEKIIKAVKPDKNYIYWAFCRWPADRDTIIYSRGERPFGLKLNPPSLWGLYQGCMPGWCFKYVVAVDNGKTVYITTKKDFGKFLGSIDNLEEAVLLATATQNVSIDEDNRKGGEYMITKSGYNLHLAHYINCPESRESILIKIDKNNDTIQRTNWVHITKAKVVLLIE